MDKLQEYLDNYQDMFIEQRLELSRYPNNIALQELIMISQHIDNLVALVDSQNNLTESGIKTFEKNYDNLIQSIHNKIKYIKDSAVVFNKLNVTYDKNSIIDYVNVKITEEGIPEELVYNSNLNGFTLPKNTVTVNCPYTISNNNLIVHNSNLNLHNSIAISNPNLKYVESMDLVVLKSDGTVLNKRLDLKDILKNNIVFEHEAVASLQINIQVSYRDEENLTELLKSTILNGFKFSLNLNTYTNFACQTFKDLEFNYGKYLIFNDVIKIPTDCYCNYNITINNLTFTIPVGNSVVCKRLDLLNKKEVKKIIGMYIKNNYTEEDLDVDYLLSLPNLNEKYVIYISKLTDNTVLNNKVKIINNNSFSVIDTTLKLDVSLQLELYSFNSANTPLLKSITGFTKDE